MLSRSLDQHVIAQFDAALAHRPLKSIGHHRADEHRGLGRQVIADFRDQNIGHKVEVVGEATEQMGRVGASRLSAVADARFTKTGAPAAAVRAAAAAFGAFENDAVAFSDAVDRRGLGPELFNPAEDFMAENQRVR